MLLKRKTINNIAILVICLVGIFAPTDFGVDYEGRKLQLDQSAAPQSGTTKVRHYSNALEHVATNAVSGLTQLSLSLELSWS